MSIPPGTFLPHKTEVLVTQVRTTGWDEPDYLEDEDYLTYREYEGKVGHVKGNIYAPNDLTILVYFSDLDCQSFYRDELAIHAIKYQNWWDIWTGGAFIKRSH